MCFKIIKSKSKGDSMKNKSYSLYKKEKERFSIITHNLDNCFICDKKRDHLHEIFFGAKHRQLSIKYGLVLPLCYKCHETMQKESILQELWHTKGQETFEKEYPNLNFMEIFGKNYK